jgi:hypothetical protein
VDNVHWQLEGSTAELYQRYLVPAITTKWAQDLIGRAQPRADTIQLETVLKGAGFGAVEAQAVVQTIAFPSVLDYVRFQLLATPMTVLLKDRSRSRLGTAHTSISVHLRI